MLSGMPTARGIHCSYELRIGAELLKHAHMFAPNWAVREGDTRFLCNCSRGPDRHCAVDDRQQRFEKLDVAGGLTNKIVDDEWKADMQNVDLPDLRGRWRNVHSYRMMTRGDDLEERPAHFSQSDNNDLLLFPHCRSCSRRVQV